jgi:cytochrome c oxidase subunit 2
MLAALAFCGSALADGGGFSPVKPASPNADRISSTYWFIFAFAAAIFLLVEIALVVFIVRFRSRGRPREVEGPQIRGHTNLELAWTAVPVLMLAAIAIFVLYKLPGIKDVPAAGAAGSQLRVGIEARQFYWQYTYPNGVVAIDRMRVPVGRPVRLEVTAPVDDVIHSWWIPALGGKIDAIPGHPNHTWFEARKPGTWKGQCAEFCGIQHAAMLATVEAVPADQFDSWLAGEARAQTEGTSDLGAQEFAGVCAKCHGNLGQGGIGPAISSSSVIQDRKSLDTIVRQGSGLMPAVGAGWSDRQMAALFSYLQKRFGSGG